jgi:hypothetical protein
MITVVLWCVKKSAIYSFLLEWLLSVYFMECMQEDEMLNGKMDKIFILRLMQMEFFVCWSIERDFKSFDSHKNAVEEIKRFHWKMVLTWRIISSFIPLKSFSKSIKNLISFHYVHELNALNMRELTPVCHHQREIEKHCIVPLVRIGIHQFFTSFWSTCMYAKIITNKFPKSKFNHFICPKNSP